MEKKNIFNVILFVLLSALSVTNCAEKSKSETINDADDNNISSVLPMDIKHSSGYPVSNDLPKIRVDYRGTMVRGNTSLNIIFSFGDFINQKPVNFYYAYTRYNIPIALRGEFDSDGILYLMEGEPELEGVFIFENFIANDSVISGRWIKPSEPDNPYKVTLTKVALDGMRLKEHNGNDSNLENLSLHESNH